MHLVFKTLSIMRPTGSPGRSPGAVPCRCAVGGKGSWDLTLKLGTGRATVSDVISMGPSNDSAFGQAPVSEVLSRFALFF